jgi:hypothetical protein
MMQLLYSSNIIKIKGDERFLNYGMPYLPEHKTKPFSLTRVIQNTGVNGGLWSYTELNTFCDKGEFFYEPKLSE